MKYSTKREPLPYKDAPLGVHDLIQRQVNFEHRLLAHKASKESVTPPSIRVKIPKMKYSDTRANWAKANILRRTLSSINPLKI